MSLLPRPTPAGDRLNWRPTPVALKVVEPMPAVDRGNADALAAELERRDGTRKALDYLASRSTSPVYRRTRAHLAMCRAVERQALIAGLGHLHVGTTPCGSMCEPMGEHRATPWRDR